jgi:hypothetical protein
MKKLIISLGLSALLLGGVSFTLHNNKVEKLAGGEKEPRVLSSSSITLE